MFACCWSVCSILKLLISFWKHLRHKGALCISFQENLFAFARKCFSLWKLNQRHAWKFLGNVKYFALPKYTPCLETCLDDRISSQNWISNEGFFYELRMLQSDFLGLPHLRQMSTVLGLRQVVCHPITTCSCVVVVETLSKVAQLKCGKYLPKAS